MPEGDVSLCQETALAEQWTEQATEWHQANWWGNTGPEFNAAWLDARTTFPPSSGTMEISLLKPTTPCPNCAGKEFESGEYRSNCHYGFDDYEARFKAVQGDGLITTFFTYGGGDLEQHDEIDVEVFDRPFVNSWLGAVPPNLTAAGPAEYIFIHHMPEQ